MGCPHVLRAKDSKQREVLFKISYAGEMPVDSSPTKFVLSGCKLANKSQRLKGTLSGV